jgi:hypothetical protein
MKALAIIFISIAMFMVVMACGGLYRKEFSGLGYLLVITGLIDIIGLMVLVAIRCLS